MPSPRRRPAPAPFAIALTLTGTHFAAIPLTGSSVNPARSLAPAIVSGTYDSLWVYLTAPFLGAIIGWAAYRLFNPPDEELEDEDEEADEDLEDDLEEELEEAG